MKIDKPARGLHTIAVGVFLLGMAASAQAVVIPFEGFANQVYGAPIVRSGFVIGNPAGQEQHFHEIASTGFGLPNNGTGILLNDRDTQIFVEVSGGGTFTFDGVDVAAALNNNPADSLRVEGFLNNVSVGFVDVAALGNGYTSLGGAFGSIDRLVFDGFGGFGGFVLDNLALNEVRASVPEGSTLALLMLGMAAAARVRSRQRKA